ncbi:hypothetical protein EVAR_67751_1 [Eumeta japonica]|uniref:Uncharacterized protein n=1 Tax=Eumeta variegata TaxID=151549 RepID=A0A4C1ZGR4_EUMVA|nr:hypothetical protein EVAR_67751_1 [Eumeta japonica]
MERTQIHPKSTSIAEVVTGKISDRCGRGDQGTPFSDTYRGRGLIFESSKRRFNFIFTPATRRYDETFIGGFHETRRRNINCGGAPCASSAPLPAPPSRPEPPTRKSDKQCRRSS